MLLLHPHSHGYVSLILLLIVQKKDGTAPEAMVSSEFAAMFDLCVLPELLKPYLNDDITYEQHCRQHAQRLGLHWTEVHYPFFLSMDNCRKHPWARKLMTRPRVDPAEQSSLLSAAHAVQLFAGRGAVPSVQHGPVYEAWLESTQAEHDRVVAAFREAQGCEVWQHHLWVLAKSRKELRLVHPEQYMPLTPITPDLHQVVENMVGTQKGHVKQCMEDETRREDLYVAATYQKYIAEGIKDKGNGAVGLSQIRGSCAKQPHTCAIVAADKGTELIIYHQFESKAVKRDKLNVLKLSGDKSKKVLAVQARVRKVAGTGPARKGRPPPAPKPLQNRHVVYGTGGAYPELSKWQ